MGLRVSDVLRDEIAKAKRATNRAIMAPYYPGCEKKQAVLSERLRTLRDIANKLAKKKLILWEKPC